MEIQSDEHSDFRGSTGGGGSSMDDSNFYQEYYTVHWPYEAPDHLEVTDLQTEDVWLIDLTELVNQIYGFFKRESTGYPNQSIADLAIEMTYKYPFDGDEKAEAYIHEDYIDGFDWSYLEGIGDIGVENAIVTYIGAYESFDHTFTVEITDYARILKFYAVFDDGQWWILGGDWSPDDNRQW